MTNRKIILTTFLVATGFVLCISAMVPRSNAQDAPVYTGASECGVCHRGMRSEFDTSAHAMTFQAADEAVMLADFSSGAELRTVQFPGEATPRPFTMDDVAFVMGTGRYAQNFVHQTTEGDYRVLPAQWNVPAAEWQPLMLAESWDDPAYDWGANCASCHTTNFDATAISWDDDGVQCEACHGPGGEHVDLADFLPRNADPEEVDEVRNAIATFPPAETCGTCHARGADPIHWGPTGHAAQANMQYDEWLNTGHATALESLLGSDEAEDACLVCHSADYRARQTQIAAFEADEWEGTEPQPLTLTEASEGVGCTTCHQTHGETEHDFGLIAEPVQLCIDCHQDTPTTDGIHHPVQQFYTGADLVEGFTGIPSRHATLEDAPDCMTCHMPTVPIDNGARVTHAMLPVLSTDDALQNTCAVCHDDLSGEYLTNFVADTQSETQERLDAIEIALADQSDIPPWVSDAIDVVDGDGSLGIHNVAYTDTLLSAVELELGLVAEELVLQAAPFIDPNTCTECHQQEVNAWQTSPHANASLNDDFLHQFADEGRPTYCMSCHASGYNPTTGEYHAEGVTCTSCHTTTSESEHPPAPLSVSNASASCGQCHSGAHAPAYNEWLVSDHQRAGVDCVDCHTPHNNGLILGDINTTCGDCHQESLHDEVHMAQDMTCTDCHMTTRHAVEDTPVLAITHTMSIDTSVCAECHGNTHDLTVRETNQLEQPVTRVTELQAEVDRLEETAEEDRNAGIIGGVLGALILVGALIIVNRLRRLL